MSALSERLAALPPKHRQALEWFWTRRGQLISWPEPLDGLYLVNRPKGIHRPAGWIHTLSVRQTLKSPYADFLPKGPADGVWTYDYFQEGQDPKDRDRRATNRGLMACMNDGVPVAVLIQELDRPKVQYRVRGLARVTDWVAGRFKLVGYDLAGEIPDAADQSGDIAYDTYTSSYPIVAESDLPMDLNDARKRIEAQIVVRQGGTAFRKEALTRFGGRCAISGWDVEAVLEAAHIVPYLGPHSDSPDNALLLRSDLHILFDRDLLRINPSTRRVELADILLRGPYAELAAKEVAQASGVTPATLKMRLQERAKQMAVKPNRGG